MRDLKYHRVNDVAPDPEAVIARRDDVAGLTEPDAVRETSSPTFDADEFISPLLNIASEPMQ